MVNLTSIQVVSNEPEGLDIQIDSQKIRIMPFGETNKSLPSLFLFSTIRSEVEGVSPKLHDWVNATSGFIDAYQSLDSLKIMLPVQMIQMLPEQSVQMVNEYLKQKKPFRKLAMSVFQEDPLWRLVLDASVRADLSYHLVLEEAMALCDPMLNQEALEQEALQVVALDATNSLIAIYSKAKKTDSSLKTIAKENVALIDQLHQTQEEFEISILESQEFKKMKYSEEKENTNTANEHLNRVGCLKQENALLLLQLHQVQEEIERYFIALREAEDQKDKETIPEKLARIERPTQKSVISNYGVLFDRNYYQQQGGQKRLGLLSYKFKGWKRGFDPHPLFDTEFYLEQIGLPLSALGMSPLTHYLRHGTRLNLSIHRDFDAAFYKRRNPDVAVSGIPLVIHFLNFGWREGRNPNATFDCNWYLYQYPDVADAGVNPFVHFLQYGREEGRKSSAST